MTDHNASAQFEDVAASQARLPRAIGRLFGILWRADLKRWRPLVVLAMLVTLVSKVIAVAAPVMLGDAINSLGEGGSGALDAFIWGLVAFSVARFVANALPQARDAFFAPVVQDANRAIAVDAFGHAQRLSLQFHLTRRAGALNRIIERGAGAMDYLLRFLAFNIGPTLVELALAAIVLTVRYGAAFAAASIATIVAYTVFTVIVTEWRTQQRRLLNEADTELRGRAMDSLTNFETVKAFASEDRETARYDAAQRQYNAHYVRTMRSLAALNVGQELVMAVGLLAVALLAGLAVSDQKLSIGDITAVTMMLMNLYRPLNILGWAWREIKQGVVDLEKLFGLLDVASDVPDAPDARPFVPGAGSVRFEAVSFAHQGRSRGLEGVSFEIKPGSFIGVAGPSGAGKSTLLKLLFRFYDPSSGRVLVDGQDLVGVGQVSLRSALGLVPQDVVLFNDTLRYNIGYARPDAGDDEILQAARRARLGAFIEGLPAGLDTRVGERGMKLSGGERQRVGVARAILLDPAILVLDEATSSLDSETEAEVQAALAEAARGRTTIAVAHRLSTIAAADAILVFDDGRLVEQGRHDELLAAHGLYAAMWARQARTPEGVPA